MAFNSTKELEDCLSRIISKDIPDLYDVNDFKVWNDLGERFTGDIWNDGKYVWKMHCHSQIIKDVNPTTIFETGFNRGTSACMFLNQLRKFNGGDTVKVYSNDINPRSLVNADKLSAEFPNFEFVLGDSMTTLEPFLEKNKPELDYVFVDGAHSYEGAKSDCLAFQPYVKKGGVIVVDDCWIDGVKDGTLDAKWDGWEAFEIPRYERQALVFIKN